MTPTPPPPHPHQTPPHHGGHPRSVRRVAIPPPFACLPFPPPFSAFSPHAPLRVSSQHCYFVLFLFPPNLLKKFCPFLNRTFLLFFFLTFPLSGCPFLPCLPRHFLLFPFLLFHFRLKQLSYTRFLFHLIYLLPPRYPMSRGARFGHPFSSIPNEFRFFFFVVLMFAPFRLF